MFALLDLWPDLDALHWRSRARCRGVGSSVMHPTDDSGARVALSYCRECEVRSQCASFDREHGCWKWGTWGGRVVVGREVYDVCAPVRRPWRGIMFVKVRRGSQGRQKAAV
jgi:hypothetical protein